MQTFLHKIPEDNQLIEVFILDEWLFFYFRNVVTSQSVLASNFNHIVHLDDVKDDRVEEFFTKTTNDMVWREVAIQQA